MTEQNTREKYKRITDRCLLSVDASLSAIPVVRAEPQQESSCSVRTEPAKTPHAQPLHVVQQPAGQKQETAARQTPERRQLPALQEVPLNHSYLRDLQRSDPRICSLSVSLSDTAAMRSPPSSTDWAAGVTVAASGRSLSQTASSDTRTSRVALTTTDRSGMLERRRGAADAHADTAERELDPEHARTVRAGPYHPWVRHRICVSQNHTKLNGWLIMVWLF